MKHAFDIRAAGVIACAALLSLAAPASAQDLPDARTVLDRYAEAVGGEEAWTRLGSSRMQGTLSMPAMGMEGTFRSYAAAPNLKVDEMELPGYGTIRMGFDGAVAWSVDPMSGPRILDGGERDMIVDDAAFFADLRRAEDIRSAEVIERAEIDGAPCYRLRVVRESGREITECYHVETGLRVAQTSTQDSPMGSVEATVYYDGWEEIDGVLIPKRLTQESMGQRMIISIDEITFGQVDREIFELPSSIRTILD